MFQSPSMDHIRCSILDQLSTQIKQYILSPSSSSSPPLSSSSSSPSNYHSSLLVPFNISNILESVSVQYVKPLLFSSLNSLSKHFSGGEITEYSNYLSSNYGISLSELKKKTNISLILATIQNIALSKSH